MEVNVQISPPLEGDEGGGFFNKSDDPPPLSPSLPSHLCLPQGGSDGTHFVVNCIIIIVNRLNLLETFYVIPKILYMQQREFTEITLAGDVGVFFKSNEFYLLGGLTYRNLDAFVFSIGAKKDSYIAKVSYDINSSSLAPASTGRGGFELSFTYMHQKKESQNVKICPRL